MINKFTKQLLLTGSIMIGLTTVSVASPIPEYPGNREVIQPSKKFKSEPRQAKIQANECAVLIQLPEDLQEWIPNVCFACSPDKPNVNPSGDYLYLSPGIYDIVASFLHVNTDFMSQNDYKGYVVLEEVEVTGDMTIEIDPSTITNHISFEPRLPDDEPVVFPVINIDNFWNQTTVSEGSMPFSDLIIYDFIVGPGWSVDMSKTTNAYINEETPWGSFDPTLWLAININDVSDRIHLGVAAELGTPEYDLAKTLFMSAEQIGSKAGVISNDPQEYVVREFNLPWTPDGMNTESLLEEYPDELEWVCPYGYAIKRIGGDMISLSGSSIMTGSRDPEFYRLAFSRNKIEDPWVHFIVAPTKTELVKSGYEIIQTVNLGAWMQPFDEGEWIVYPDGGLAKTEESPIATFPFYGVDLFMTAPDNNEDVMFMTAPLLSTTIEREINSYEEKEYYKFNIFSTGRMGEMRNSDFSMMKSELSVNGVQVANAMWAIDEWWNTWNPDTAGETELKLTDSNFEIDGTRTSTISTTHFDTRQADFFPPSVTMMQIRNSEGTLTSKLDPGMSNSIFVAAGDFNSGEEVINYYGQTATITSQPAVFELSYASAGSEEWVEVDCGKVNEDVIAGIGIIYKAEMNDKKEGWKDLKIRVEDETGNWMEQVIEKAFYVNQSTGAALRQGGSGYHR